jgi:hypothetical protein
VFRHLTASSVVDGWGQATSRGPENRRLGREIHAPEDALKSGLRAQRVHFGIRFHEITEKRVFGVCLLQIGQSAAVVAERRVHRGKRVLGTWLRFDSSSN